MLGRRQHLPSIQRCRSVMGMANASKVVALDRVDLGSASSDPQPSGMPEEIDPGPGRGYSTVMGQSKEEFPQDLDPKAAVLNYVHRRLDRAETLGN